MRLSGEPIALPFPQRQCAPNEEGVELPTQNVAIDGARTLAALTATPENPDPGHAMQYPRVLPPGMSQVTAMEAQNPKLVSVELGGNDILGARYGVYPSATEIVPVARVGAAYRQIAARVDAAAKHAVLVGLLNDVRSFPSFRTGDEIWNARATFAPFNVAVSNDCAEQHQPALRRRTRTGCRSGGGVLLPEQPRTLHVQLLRTRRRSRESRTTCWTRTTSPE